MRQVFIAGASSEVGRELSLRYLKNGFRVLAHYFNGSCSLSEFKNNISYKPIFGDFSDAKSFDDFYERNQHDINNSSIYINSVGLLKSIDLVEIKTSDILQATMANAIAHSVLTIRIASAMADRGFGRIVNISSIGVKYGGGDQSYCYSFSKHASEFMPRQVKQWAKNNVLLNIVRSGVLNTSINNKILNKNMDQRRLLIPMQRFGTIEELVNFIYWAGSEQNTYMTGQVIALAGGE